MKVQDLFETYGTMYRQVLSESTLENFKHVIQTHMDAGEIVKPEYERLKDRVNREIRREGEKIFQEHCAGKGEEIHALREDALSDLVYACPGSANEVLSLKNKLARVKENKNHPLYKALEAFYNEHKELAEQLKALKDKVVTTAKKREAVKVEREVQLKKKFTDSESFVKTLEQHLGEYVKRAGEMAAEQYENIMALLKKHDWDIDKAAPKPEWNDPNLRFKAEKRALLMSLSDGKDNIRKASASKKAEHIRSAERGAHASYMAWVAKMIDKIGKVVQSSEMNGSPWTGSTLHVVTKDGESQTWHTKMILNQSKYGMLFNQFPSRRLK